MCIMFMYVHVLGYVCMHVWRYIKRACIRIHKLIILYLIYMEKKEKAWEKNYSVR